MSNKIGQLSRADLLQVILKKDDGVSQKILADALGIEWSPPESGIHDQVALDDSQSVIPFVSQPEALEANNELTNPSPTAQLRSSYWQLLEQKNREDDPPDEEQSIITQRPVWRNKPERPAFPALMSETAIQQRLLPCLRQEKTTQRVDVDVLIEQVGCAEFITELPMQQRRRDTQALQIIDDRQVHLMPYWLDHSWLTWHLIGVMPEYRLSRAVIEQGESEPQSISSNELRDYQSPPEGSTVLLLSDLGVLSGRLQTYQALLEQWLRQGYHVVVVTPCHIADYPGALSSRITFISWETGTCSLPEKGGVEEGSLCLRQAWAELLLSLCSATVRLEPELLRHVRYALNQYLLLQGEQPLPVSAESLAWQHSAVVQKHSVAATVDVEQNKDWRAILKQQPIELKQAVFEAVRKWRVTLPDEIWFEEFLAVERCCDEGEREKLTWFEDDAADVGAFFSYMGRSVLSGGERVSVEQLPQNKAWMQRVAGRMTGEAVTDGQFRESVRRCLYWVRDDNGQVSGGHVLDPRLESMMASGKPVLPLKSAWLCQLGNRLVVTLHDALEIPRQRSSLIARLDYRALQLNVIQAGKTKEVTLPEHLDGEFIPLVGTEGLAPQALRLQTDLTELRLDGFERPAWAKRVGRDVYGLFAELAIPNDQNKELVQCFRWIPAGTFMMGSLESEAERYSDEHYHQMILTNGYWLADTVVTQAVWLAIMGNNPAQFSDDMSNPVEQVSWEDSQHFILKLTSLIAASMGQLVMRLPSEFEWEYACRAGTVTPFSFGDNITSEQVNFGGSNLAKSSVKSERRDKTAVVKSLPANQWGLYEMHGNVWELCADAWQEDVGLQSMANSDSYHNDNDSVYRVSRGGSWTAPKGHVRSAFRDNISPDFSSKEVGFRLFLSQKFRNDSW